MNLKKHNALVLTMIITMIGLSCRPAKAQLPADFPHIVVSNYNPAAVSPGSVFLAVASELPDVGVYLMIVTNDGSVVWHEKLAAPEIYDFKVLPNGHLACAPFIEDHSWTGGGDAVHQIRDASYALRETIIGGNRYVAESHDFQLLPNGNVLQFGYYMSEVDMSLLVPGGHPAALVSGGVVQELDAQRNVIFQWRTWDAYPFAGNVTSTNAVINAFHLNTIDLDTDGQLLIGTPQWVKKLNRQTGELLWHLGGAENQFTFVGVTPQEGTNHFGGHNFNRLANGNVLIYDNGPRQGAGTSMVHEYTLDEVNKVATRVWNYTPPTAIKAWHRGSAQRLANGNTFIGWGGASGAAIPTCTEVTPAGQKVFEIFFTNSLVESYRAFRYPWPPTQKLEATELELATGNTYTFTGTGVSLEVQAGGGGYNSFTVTREPYAPVDPLFPDTVPRVLPIRVKLSGTSLTTMTVLVSFDAVSFGFSQPGNLTIFHRASIGQGVFLPRETGYNPVTRQLSAILPLELASGDFGEIIFGYPDLADVPYPPLLAKVENDRGAQTHEVIAPPLAATGAVYSVNQQRPISLAWSPKGLARWYELQISTNQDFATPLVSVPFQTTAYYVWSNAAPNTTYFYRVKTWNDGGSSAWSVGAFQTIAPSVQVTAPNGGEAWQRGLKYFVRWQDNLAESVVIDLYKGGVFLKSLATNSSAGAFAWTVGLDLAPGDDYAVRVRSATNAALFDSSDTNFTLGDLATVTIATAPPGRTVVVDGANYTAPASFDWLAGSIHTLNASSPQTAADGSRRDAFASWSHGAAQSNSIVVPSSATNYTANFTTQFLLDTAVTPAGTGTISNAPAGPWYDAGQTVALTALTNAGYRFRYWLGVDGAVSNTAQVTMNSYRSVEAGFILSDFPHVVVTNTSGAAPGSLIGNIAGRNADGTRTHYVILDHTGTNFLYVSRSNALLRFGTPQSLVTDTNASGFRFKDESITNAVNTVRTLGYPLDPHDVKLLPNGHTFVFGSETRTFDMSAVVPGGKTAASVLGNVVQELDANQRLVFEWHTFDHIAITNTFADMTQASFDYAHINAMALDPTDNHLLLSLRTTSEIVKVNRRTGQVVWRLGGKRNQFTFIGEHPENAPYYTIGQHDMHRLANGNLLYFDNGNIAGGGVTPNDRNYSRMVEYALDETNMTATLVWEYRHTPDIQANCTGSLKRMPNGNTFIDWGCAVPGSGYIVTEVNPAGQVVFEMRHRTNSGVGSVLLGGGLTKQLWNTPELIRSASFSNVQAGQICTAVAAGVSATINSLSGPTNNALTLERHLDAVRLAQFPGKAPQVVNEHVVLTGSNLTTLTAELTLDLPDTSYVSDTPKIHDPVQVTVYHRPTPGQGPFSPLATAFTDGKLRVNTAPLGEYVFGYPDVDETPQTPWIDSPPNASEVNQAQPVTLDWTPQGLIGSSDLQVSTNAGFSSLLLDTNGLGSSSFAFANLLPNTQHYWRVRVVNGGGTSDWASASFSTVPPVLQITVPAGGEVWQRFQAVTLRWIDNLSENLVIELYKGGVSNRTISANAPSSGSFSWTVGQFAAIPPGSDYTFRIRSTTTPSLFDFSEPFSIITNRPAINAGSLVMLPDGNVQFSLSATGAPQATVFGSTNLSSWEPLGVVPVVNGSALFTDSMATNFANRYYRVRVP